MGYDTATKAARMTQTRDRLNSGFIDVLNGVGTTLCSWPLDAVSGSVSGPVLSFSGFPKTALTQAAATGLAPPTSAQLRSATGVIIKAGLTVGLSGAELNLSALAWSANDPVQLSTAPTLTHAA